VKREWHALFAPLPDDAVVKRKPVGSGDAIAGWESVSVDLSAGAEGLRHVMVTLDGSGTPIAAGDWVLYASEAAEGTTYVHENVGGRLEADGSFQGTRWHSVAFQKPDAEDAQIRESRHMPPTAEDVAAIKSLVNELLTKANR